MFSIPNMLTKDLSPCVRKAIITHWQLGRPFSEGQFMRRSEGHQKGQSANWALRLKYPKPQCGGLSEMTSI